MSFALSVGLNQVPSDAVAKSSKFALKSDATLGCAEPTTTAQMVTSPKVQLDHVLLDHPGARLPFAVTANAGLSPFSDHRALVVEFSRPSTA